MAFTFVVVVMVLAFLASVFIPNKFDSEINGILYHGYSDLTFDEALLQKGNYYNFGHYSLRIRFLTIDIESIARDKVVWSSPIDQSFLSCSSHQEVLNAHEDSFYAIDDTNVYERCKAQIVTDIKKKGTNSLQIFGTFSDCYDVSYQIDFIELEGIDGKPKLEFNAKCIGPKINRIYFRTRSTPLEQFYGLGEQFSFANLKGRIFNTFVREKGIARGDEPLTTLANALFANAGGRYANTYNPSTVAMSTYNRAIYLDTTAYTIWDFSDQWSVNILVWDSEVKGQFLSAPDLKRLITRVTQITGRMKPLPKWIQNGAVIAVQGGTDKLQEIITRFELNDIPIAGFWIQDWVNKRQSNGYSRLWWNWELDDDHYPRWNDVVQRLLKKDIRIMTYVNPMLTDVTERKHSKVFWPWIDRNLFSEARAKGFLIHNNKSGELFMTKAFSTFSAGLLDLTNPDAVRWYKQIIKEEMLHKSQVFGFMADFGEASPIGNMDLDDKKIDLMSFHQTYPLRWQRLVSEAIEEYCVEQDTKDDYVFFTRSGYTYTPNLTRLVWAGDQNQNWGRHNGIQSGLVAMISAGFSGISLTHTDVGGYTYINNEVNEYLHTRTERDKDLLIRWMEMAAFTAVFRTHEGNLPEKSIQAYDDNMLHYLRRNAYTYKLLQEYRSSLMKVASKSGLPLVRALVLEFQSDANTFNIVDQFMFGSDLMIAPILEANTFKRKVYFPRVAAKYQQNFWVHVWTGEKINGCACYKMVDAPYDQPAVYYQYLSDWEKSFQQIFKEIAKIN